MLFGRRSGPVSTKLVPQTAHASQILYLMYFVLTGAEFIALRIVKHALV